MKLSFSPASPFARKVRIAAIELGLIDRIEFIPATVVPGQPNEEYSRISPLKKLPVLILDNGEVILDSYVIVEYLDDLAGGGKLIPASGAARWKSVMHERTFIASREPRISSAVRPFAASKTPAHSRSRAPRTGSARYARASSSEMIEYCWEIQLLPSPAICGKMNQIQWLSFRPPRSSSRTPV